jgi:DNA-binding GntR family transcriptional regulator
MAATHGTPKAFAAIEANIAAMTSAKTLADVSRLDAEFHEQIVRAGGNRRLLLCWNVLHDQVALWLGQMQLQHEEMNSNTHQATLRSHCQLLDAIRSGDAAKAANEARLHVEGWKTIMPQMLNDSTAKR